jgi:hypothetical protein
MMKYTPLTRVEKKPMTSAARLLARTGRRSAPTGPVAADAEEGGGAPRHHARVAHQEIQAHGVDTPDEDLLQELHRIAAERRREGQEREDEERDPGQSQLHAEYPGARDAARTRRGPRGLTGAAGRTGLAAAPAR